MRARLSVSEWLAPTIALGGFLTGAIIFYPGLFTPDSMDQFEQSQSGDFGDWHPPVMAALWRLFNLIHVGPELIFIFHLALFWIGFWAVGDGLRLRRVPFGYLFPLAGLLPFAFNYTGLLWKDVALASAWLFAAGLAFRRRAFDAPAPIWETTSIAVAFLYGALARANTIFAAAPLALYLIDGNVFSRRLWPQAAALVAVPAFVLASTAFFNNVVVHAEKEHAESSLFLFDLTGISNRIGKNVVPGPWTPAEAAKIPSCYGADKWDHANMGDCAFISQTLDDHHMFGAPIIAQTWRKEILAHPLEYLEHRLANANAMMRWLGPIPVEDAFLENELADPRYENHPGDLYRFIEDVCVALAPTPLFRPYFWLILALSTLALAGVAADSTARRFAGGLAASAALYLMTYVPFGIGCDFRYAYWAILATMAACAALAACAWPYRGVARGVLVASGVVMAGAIGASVLS